ncbi:MAG: hypothetical protein N4A65_02470 [Cohaesibacter sp.]|jgi:hypothetical protein|nr:hypothetical protein [Cohaesibacter sp.]
MTSVADKETVDFEKLILSYIDVCNRSIEKNSDQSPYKEIFQAALAAMKDSDFSFLLRDDRPKASVSLRIEEQGIARQNESDKEPEDGWIFDYSYLKAVLDNPEDYVNEPERLDWSWLYCGAKRR